MDKPLHELMEIPLDAAKLNQPKFYTWVEGCDASKPVHTRYLDFREWCHLPRGHEGEHKFKWPAS